MPSIELTLAAWVAMFVSGLVGLGLARILPTAHTSDRSRDILGGVTGLMVLLLALVLGLLIWTAYGVTQTQKGEIQLLVNATTLGLGCAAVTSAIFLILELSHPYTSLLKLSPTLLKQVIVDLAQ